MIKKILFYFLFFSTFCYSQECLSDQYLQKSKIKDPLLEKKYKNTIRKFNEKNTNKLVEIQEVPGEELIVIPVVFNVIHSGEPLGVGKNISLSKIEEQITIMNEAYSGQYGGVDTKIKFCLAKQNSVGQQTTGVNRFLGNASYEMYYNYDFNLDADKEIKRMISSGFPNNLYLNIWVTDLKYNGQDILFGYSSFPFTIDDVNVDNLLDGVVLDYMKVGVNTTSNPNDINNSNGSVASHEVGHWLGLFHVFQDEDGIPCNESSCETQGDMICDTEVVPQDGRYNIGPGNCLGYGCVNGRPSESYTTDVVQNIMDYQSSSRLYCRTKFTAGQKKRMKDILSFYRPSIFNQGLIFNLTECKSYYIGGGSSGNCRPDPLLPIQSIIRPNIYQNLPASSSIRFGERLEVNDKWLITTYNTRAYVPVGTAFPYIANYLLIYKREGCRYALYQKIEIPLYNTYNLTDFGLQLNGNEIIISTYQKDEVYIVNFNESSNLWSIGQQIKNDSSSHVGTSTYTIGRFLFILEKNADANNIFRIYYKNDDGYYTFHQNLVVSGFDLPSLSKAIQSGNFSKKNINFNSNTSLGSYDPLEILVANSKKFAVFELNSYNMWILANTTQIGLSSKEYIQDIEMSKNYIYILTSEQTGVDGSFPDRANLYSYKYTDLMTSSSPFQNVYKKQELLYNTDGVDFDMKLQVYNDQFLFLDNVKYQPLTFFYNSNFESTNLPNWQNKTVKRIACPNLENDDFEIFGNLLFYADSERITIYNMVDILSREGFDQVLINDTDFFNKKINIVPENYSTSAQQITIGGTSEVSFNYTKKEFIANTTIILKPGTSISKGANVKLKITDNYGLCNSVITSKRIEQSFEENEEYLSNVEHENVIKINNKTVLYPNPNSGVFKLSLESNHGKVNYEIYNNVGNLIYTGNTDKSTFEINLPNIPTGVYFVNLKGDNYKETIKFIKD